MDKGRGSAKDLRKTPEQLEEELKKKDERKAKVAKVRQDIASAYVTPTGQRALRWLMAECGFHDHHVSINPQTGNVNLQTTVYQEARRSLYLKLREMIPRETLIAVENKGLEGDEENE